MKHRYERPVIQLQAPGQMNRFSRNAVPQPMTAIEGVPVGKLVERYGSPLFVFSEHRLRRQYRELRRAFSLRYPRVQMAWSYKTNYLQAICNILHQEGAWAEVVSEFEYAMARRLGVPGNHIIFNGPHKTTPGLRQAVQEGARINLDNPDELYAMLDLAAEFDRPLDVGIRVNLDAGLFQNWHRFGFNLENGEAREAVRIAVQSGRLSVRGLHCHIGTFILDVEAYRRMAQKLVGLAKELETDFGLNLDYLDTGGGFASTNTLHWQYLTGEQVTPSFDQYAEAICGELLNLKPRSGNLPLLLLESGRAVVDEAGCLVSTVAATKPLPTGLRGIVLDVGLNALFTAQWYRHQIIPAQDFSGYTEASVVYGPLCMMIDVIRDYVMLPPLRKGDRVVITPAGAYNCTQWMQWIQARPAVALIGEGGELDLIRERETEEDLSHRERVPDRLLNPLPV